MTFNDSPAAATYYKKKVVIKLIKTVDLHVQWKYEVYCILHTTLKLIIILGNLVEITQRLNRSVSFPLGQLSGKYERTCTTLFDVQLMSMLNTGANCWCYSKIALIRYM